MGRLMYRSGFSMTELICVIGIVLLVSVIAFPEYKTYTARSKILRGVDYLTARSFQFESSFNNDGVFTGISSDAGTGYLAPYVHRFTAVADGAQTCKAGYYYGYIGGYDNGVDYFVNNTGKGIIYTNYLVEVNKIVQHYCTYYEMDNNVQAADRGLLSTCQYTNAVPQAYIDAKTSNGC